MFAKFGSACSEDKLTISVSMFLISIFVFAFLFTIVSLFSPFAAAVGCEPPLQFCGGIGVVVNPGGSGSSNSTQKCSSTITSCGTYPNCFDLSQLSYCVNGHVVQPYCSGNVPKNRTMTNHCTPTTNFVMRARGHDDSDEHLTVTFFSPGTTNNPVVTSDFSGNSSMASPLPIVDATMDYDDSYLDISMKNVNVTSLQVAGTINLTIDKINASVPISGVKVYKTYLVELPSSFLFDSLVLKVRYSDVGVTNESNLVLYRCGTYNFATGNCDSGWELKSNVTRDTSGKIISLQLTGFSAYALAEQGVSTTSSTTTTATSTQSASSSSSVAEILPASSSSSSGSSSPSSSSSNPTTSSTTSSTSSSPTTSTTVTNKATGFSIVWPAFSLPMLIPMNQETFFTFFIGFVSGFAIALFVKSGLNIQSFRPRYSNSSRSRKYYEGRYRNISNVRNAGNIRNARSWNENRRSKKSSGETILALQ